ncbi:hypothetical protein NC651_003284 [Populus alba x Populus x berolinensis]|nr:hypothetical protein NC651_003284 [Populus alba x Populus x berolinensis]
MATSTLSTIRSSLNRKRLRLPPLQRISISFQFHKIVKTSAVTLPLKFVKDVSYRPPGTKLNLVNKVTFSLPEKTDECYRFNIQFKVPDMLVLDEPLVGLAIGRHGHVIKLLKRLEKKMTILVVSHDPKELATLVDHSWRMEMGGFLMEELLSV